MQAAFVAADYTGQGFADFVVAKTGNHKAVAVTSAGSFGQAVGSPLTSGALAGVVQARFLLPVPHPAPAQWLAVA